jgi:ABC-type multidrug transport system ATPase subunit
VLLVDEPFVGLDPAGQEALSELLAAAAEAGAAVVVATHQLGFLERATRCVALRDGGLVYDGPVDRAAIAPYLE